MIQLSAFCPNVILGNMSVHQMEGQDQQTIGQINQRQAQIGSHPFQSNSRFSEEQNKNFHRKQQKQVKKWKKHFSNIFNNQ